MRVGISITKKVSFRLVQQEFSNVYHYQLETAVTAPDEELVDAIVATEKKLHAPDVTFVRGQVWSADGTPAQNAMRYEKALSGVGLGLNNTSHDRERAVLAMWPAGVNSRGKPVYLRKWFHSCGSVQGWDFGANVLQNTAEIPLATRQGIAAIVDELTTIGSLSAWHICAASGREPATGTGPSIHRFLEHHQMGDAWR